MVVSLKQIQSLLKSILLIIEHSHILLYSKLPLVFVLISSAIFFGKNYRRQQVLEESAIQITLK